MQRLGALGPKLVRAGDVRLHLLSLKRELCKRIKESQYSDFLIRRWYKIPHQESDDMVAPFGVDVGMVRQSDTQLDNGSFDLNKIKWKERAWPTLIEACCSAARSFFSPIITRLLLSSMWTPDEFNRWRRTLMAPSLFMSAAFCILWSR